MGAVANIYNNKINLLKNFLLYSIQIILPENKSKQIQIPYKVKNKLFLKKIMMSIKIIVILC